MDEPLSNLDAKLRVQTRAELVELQRRLAATIVYVTHDQVEAMTMGHRIAIMTTACCSRSARRRTSTTKPANLFVARFIGSPPMNTVDRAGRRPSGEALVVAIRGQPRPARRRAYAQAVEAGGLDEVVLGVRPEHLRLVDADGRDPGDRVAWSSRSGTSAT